MVERDLPEVEGVSHRFVDVQAKDGALRLHLAQAGEGEPLLLLHGWPQHWYCWRRVVPSLAGRFRLLMPDLRGFGWSDAPGRGYEPETFAADALALLDALGIERVKVVGHDWGGYTAFVLGLDHAERIEGLIAAGTPHPWPPRSPRAAVGAWRTWYVLVNSTPVAGPALVAGGSYVAWWLGLGGRSELFPDEDSTAYTARLADRRRARASAALYRSYLRLAGRSILGRASYADRRLSVPARLLFGADDFYVPVSLLEGGERHGDDFEIELVPGCGHFVPEERPELFADRVLSFLG